MTKTEFIVALQEKARLDVAQEIASAILFSVNDSMLQYEPAKNVIFPVATDANLPETLVIFSESWDTLYGVLVGEVDLMDAFLKRSLWTNGYLPIVFRLFAVFQSSHTLRIPE